MTITPELLPEASLGGMTSPTLDASEVVYAGSHGKHDNLIAPPGGQWQNGRMYALRFEDGAFEMLWSFEIEGQLDWAHPIVAPERGLYFGSSDTFPATMTGTKYEPGTTPANASPKVYGLFEE